MQTPAPSHQSPFLPARGFNLKSATFLTFTFWQESSSMLLNCPALPSMKHLPIWELRCPARCPIWPRIPGPPTGGALSSPSPGMVIIGCVTCNFFGFLCCFRQGRVYVTLRNKQNIGLIYRSIFQLFFTFVLYKHELVAKNVNFLKIGKKYSKIMIIVM